jgi:hypothetical protein
MISEKQLKIQLPPRVEPFENKANKKKWVKNWKPRVKLSEWLKSQL